MTEEVCCCPICGSEPETQVFNKFIVVSCCNENEGYWFPLKEWNARYAQAEKYWTKKLIHTKGWEHLVEYHKKFKAEQEKKK